MGHLTIFQEWPWQFHLLLKAFVKTGQQQTVSQSRSQIQESFYLQTWTRYPPYLVPWGVSLWCHVHANMAKSPISQALS